MYFLYIIIFVFALIMLFSGVFALIWPKKWDDREKDIGRWPGYFGGHAKDSEEMWVKAQKIYGRWAIIMGILQILLANLEVGLFAFVCYFWWENEDATLPCILIIILPAFVLIGLIYLFTGIELGWKKK